MIRNLILLITAALIFFYTFYQKKQTDQYSPGNSSRSPFSEINFDSADALILSKGNSQLIIRKTNDSYMIDSLQCPADQGKVTGLFKNLSMIKLLTLSSKNPEKTAVFGFSGEFTSVSVSRKGENLACFEIGRSGPDNITSYVRFPGQHNVYLASINLVSLTDNSEYNWVSQDFTSLCQAQIRSFNIKTETAEISAVLKDSWVSENGLKHYSSEEVNEFISSITSARHISVMRNDNLPAPCIKILSISLKTENGITRNIHLLKSQNSYYVNLDSIPAAFRLPDNISDKIIEKSSVLIAK